MKALNKNLEGVIFKLEECGEMVAKQAVGSPSYNDGIESYSSVADYFVKNIRPTIRFSLFDNFDREIKGYGWMNPVRIGGRMYLRGALESSKVPESTYSSFMYTDNKTVGESDRNYIRILEPLRIDFTDDINESMKIMQSEISRIARKHLRKTGMKSRVIVEI
jgi:hypothetical protein